MPPRERERIISKGGGSHTILGKLKGKGVLKINKKKVALIERQILANAQLQILEDVRARFDDKYEELYAILHLKYVSVEHTDGDKRIEFNSPIRRVKFIVVEFLVVEFERANIDDGKKVAIIDYLKTVQPIFKHDSNKHLYANTINLLTKRYAEEIRQIRNNRPNTKYVEEIFPEGDHMRECLVLKPRFVKCVIPGRFSMEGMRSIPSSHT